MLQHPAHELRSDMSEKPQPDSRLLFFIRSGMLAIRTLISIPCWLGAVLFFLTGLLGIMHTGARIHVLLALGTGGTTLAFLLLQLLSARSLLMTGLLTLLAGLSIMATMFDHTFRETELLLLPADCGLPVMAHLANCCIWYSIYVAVPWILLCRLLGISERQLEST